MIRVFLMVPPQLASRKELVGTFALGRDVKKDLISSA
jgi:hypothetical protein